MFLTASRIAACENFRHSESAVDTIIFLKIICRSRRGNRVSGPLFVMTSCRSDPTAKHRASPVNSLVRFFVVSVGQFDNQPHDYFKPPCYSNGGSSFEVERLEQSKRRVRVRSIEFRWLIGGRRLCCRLEPVTSTPSPTRTIRISSTQDPETIGLPTFANVAAQQGRLPTACSRKFDSSPPPTCPFPVWVAREQLGVYQFRLRREKPTNYRSGNTPTRHGPQRSTQN